MGYLAVGMVADHVLALAVARVASFPPGEHRLTLVRLDLEVHHIHILVLQEAQPHGLSVVIEDHASVLPRTGLPGPVLRGDEDVAGSSIMLPRDHLDNGRWRSGRERKFHACPAGADAAGAPGGGGGARPTEPPEGR